MIAYLRTGPIGESLDSISPIKLSNLASSALVKLSMFENSPNELYNI